MTDSSLKKKLCCLLFAPILMCGAAIIFPGCGGEEEAAPVEETPSAPAGEAAPPETAQEVATPAAAIPPAALAETVPVTLPALAYMPEEAQFAVALPPLPGLTAEILPLVKALSAPDRDVDAELKDAISELGEEIGVSADSYEGLASTLGVDPEAPIAAFADFRKTIASAAEAKVKYDAEQAAREAEVAAAGDTDATAGPEGADPSEEEASDEPELAPDYFKDADEPAWVVVLGVTDPEKARTELDRIVAADSDLSDLESGSEEVDGTTLTTRGDYGYFTTEKHIVFGNLELLRGAARRVKAPATFRYGTVECPPTVANEAVALMYGGRFLEQFETAIPLLGMDSNAQRLMAAQMLKYKDMFSAGGDDPMVITASMAEGQIELLSRIDNETHEGMMDKIGQPGPLRLARYLPENTLVMAALRFTEEYKKQLIEEVVPVVGASDDPSAAGTAGMATQVINQIGDELSIGITSASGGFPALYALLGLSQPDATKGLLQMFVPMPDSVEYEGYSIGKIAAFPGLDISLSFVDNFLAAGTTEDGVKAIIDLHKAQKASPLFASMEPPLDIEMPVYNTVVFNSAMIEQALGVAAMLSMAPAQPDPSIARITNAIREVRAVGALEGTWLTSHFTVYLKDLEAAQAASRAAAPAPGADGSEAAPAAQ